MCSKTNEASFPLLLLNYVVSKYMTVFSGPMFPRQIVEALTQVYLLHSVSNFHETCKSVVISKDFNPLLSVVKSG